MSSMREAAESERRMDGLMDLMDGKIDGSIDNERPSRVNECRGDDKLEDERERERERIGISIRARTTIWSFLMLLSRVSERVKQKKEQDPCGD